MIFAAIDPALGAMVVAVVTALATYLVAARGLSGKIKNSDAEELWAESRSIREWSTKRVQELNQHVDNLERRLNDLERKNDELAAENRKLMREIFDLRANIIELEGENRSLISQLEYERTEVIRLKTVAEGAPRRRFSDENAKGGSNGGTDTPEGG